MSNALVTLFVLALMITAVLTWSMVSIGAVDSGAESWKEMVNTAVEVSRTDIRVNGAEMRDGLVEVLVHNRGEVRLADFHKWDIIVSHYDEAGALHISSLSYAGGEPVNGEWTVAAIYTDTSLSRPEVFEPGILNPGEAALLMLDLDPVPATGTVNQVIISTPSGVVASKQFQG
ncbi:MAG: hypothetical protein IBX68_08000 [Dehalococcoidia bacterium]|nr:hypothetical protein [Dehalococcoidia bacterium]